MCGSYFIVTAEQILEIQALLQEIEQRTNIAAIVPTNKVPVLLTDPEDEHKLIPRLMAWGFPQYRGSGVVINARSETIEEKPMFREAVRQRCLVPASGFYEFTGVPGKKTRHALWAPGVPYIYLAGCYSSITTGAREEQQRFVIATTDANIHVAPIHSRMPVVLHPHEGLTWLGESFRTLFDRSQLMLSHRLAPRPQEDKGQQTLFS